MKLKGLSVWVLVVAIAICTPIIASRTVAYLSMKEWNDVQAQAKKAGVPLTFDEALKDYQPGPDATNAAEGAKTYLRAVLKPSQNSHNEFMGGLKDNLKAASKTISDETKKRNRADQARVRRAVEQFEPHLTKLQAEIQKPDWNWKRPWNQGYAMLMPDGAGLKEASKVLLAKAYAQWSENPGESIRALQSVMRLSRHMESEPNLILVMVAVSLRSLTYQTALNLGVRPGTTEAQRQQLSDAARDADLKVNWRRLWRMEFIAPMSSLYMVTSEKGFYVLGLKPDQAPMRSERAMYQTQAAMGRLYLQSEEELNRSPMSLTLMRTLSDRYFQDMNDLFNNFHDVFAKLSSGENSFRFAIDAIERNEAIRRMTHIALELGLDLQATSLPPVANKAEWFDPYSGKPLRFKRIKGGYLLYSVGVNKIDDGGSTTKDANGDRPDIVLTVTPAGVTVQ